MSFMSNKSLVLASLACMSISFSAVAQMDHSTMPHHSMPAAGKGAESPFVKEMMGSMNKMHTDMMDPAKLTGDADKDFMHMMIPHHQGAIIMAESVLKHGKDPKIKKLANEIIKAQKKEIAQMQDWLKNGKK